MAEDKIVQKKPFLKKGTRKFLSNAQVRSQSQKPKIHNFQVQQELPTYQPIQVKSQNRVPNNDDQIKIKAKPSNLKMPIPKRQSSTQKKDRHDGINQNSIGKPKRQMSIIKKKQAVLSDYIENESGITQYQNKKSRPKDQQPIYIKSKKDQDKKKQQTDRNFHLTRTTNLIQQYSDQQQTANFIDNNYKQPINPTKPRQSSRIPKQKPNPFPKKTKQPIPPSTQQPPQINFISDKSDSQQNEPKYKKKSPHDYPEQHRKQNLTQNQSKISKIKLNYFNKDSDKSKYQQEPIKQKQLKKQITINDISKQLKQIIINQTISNKQQQIFQTLLKIKQKQQHLKKQKQKLQDEYKLFHKSKLEFDKQMESKYHQFQEKIKSENLKLTRQKKYLKQAQTSGKIDWKIKSELQQSKKIIQQLKEQKKKSQSKFKLEIQNLRKKIQQQTNKNKVLTQQVKLFQYGQLIQKQQLKQINKQQKKNLQQQKALIWTDAPQFSYLNKITNQNFSLIGINMSDYHYQLNQYYQYYLKIKDQSSPLQSQTQDPDRAKRVYKNGKIQYQYFQKFLKQIYPFNYTIVHLWNGDVKQILPSSIQIYYSKNSGVTQITIKQNGYHKEICFFPNNDTAQMTAVYDNEPSKNVTEVYCNGQLKRMLSDGSVILQKRDSKGNVISIPMN